MLGNHEQKEEFLEFINEDYEDIRADYFDNLKDKKYLSLAISNTSQPLAGTPLE